ncbi:MAG: lysophospholipase [Asgard group archaeon]|nr:lysophospholipase [Asgard group archaeon]
MADIEERMGSFTTFDGQELFYRVWYPLQEKKNEVFIGVHGASVHSSNMINPGVFFAKKGYAFFVFDRRGHGHNEVKNRGHVKKYTNYIKDIDSFILFLKEKEKPDKIHLIGHSNGGSLAIIYGINNPTRINTIIASGPSIKLEMKKGNLFFAKLAAKIIGTILPRIKIKHGVIKPEELVRDKAILEARLNDPLYVHKNSARWVRELFNFQRYLDKNIKKLSVPTLFLLGSNDKIIDYSYTIKAFQKIEKKNIMTLTIYKEHLHELFNESEEKRIKIFHDIERFIG